MSYIEIQGVNKTFEDGRQILKGINLSIEKGEFITLLGPNSHVLWEASMSYIEIQGVNKTFEDGRQILKGINLSIEKGEFITLLGASGCGKTTLLRSIAGLVGIDSGSIRIDGEDITHVSPRQRNLAMVFQQYSLFPSMNVYDNIAYGLRIQKMPRNEIDQKVKEALALIEMEGSEAKYPSQLSGGEQQRVSLARGIVTNPKVLLLDEPFSAIDAKLRKALQIRKYPSQLSGGEQQRVSLARGIVTNPKVLLLDEPFSAIDAKLRKALQIRIKNIHTSLGITTIFVTHDQEEAMRMSDRIYLMNAGRVEQSGSPMELYLSPKTHYAASFIGHYNIIPGELWALLGFTQDPSGSYAVRPESICLSDTPPSQGQFTLEGVVKQVIYQGNVIRYTVTAGQLQLDVDQLYEGQHQFYRGDTVYLMLDNKDVIHYEA